LGFLNDAVQDNQFSADLRAVERTANPFRSLAPQFEQSVLHRPLVRHPQVQSTFFKKLRQPKKVCVNTDRPLLYLALNAFIEEED
jgi:hypothetical protein